MVARALALLSLAGVACQPDLGTVPFDDEHKLRALRLISVFENGSAELQYAYVEDLGDGRGFTCGLGFTTGTGDASEVAHRYQDSVGDNPLTPFLPELERLRALDEGEGSDDTGGLAGFPVAWARSADDERFRALELAVTDEQSYTPALEHLSSLGLASALGLMLLYDAEWMHGDGDDADGVPALIDRTPSAVDARDEHSWLAAFLDVRRRDLLDPADPDTRDEWREAVGRVDVLRELLDDGNLAFTGPLVVGHGYDVEIP